MARALNRLTVRQVSAAKDPGRHSDGGGLYLRVTPGGARAWVFMTATAGKRVEIGLGPASSVPLATARRLSAQMREAVATGSDPRAVIAPATPLGPVEITTFGKFAEDYIASVEAGWRNAVHRQQWRQSLKDHARGLTDLPIGDISTDDVLAVLQPIWLTKAETAKRVRGRIEKTLDAAKARGLRSRESMNPAVWRGHLALLLPMQSKLARGHHPALPWSEAPEFVAALRQRRAVAARCLEFVILTAARSGEALGATWSEIDTKAQLWTIPAGRMKAGVEHVVPLSSAAVALLTLVNPSQTSLHSPVFAVGGVARSNMAMAMLLRRMGHGNITTHGFRSTFRDWAGDATAFPREIVEQALAHTIQNQAERAYRRGTAVERRRELMEAWAEFITPRPVHLGAS
ncbi:integrase arm-type DNA-binding domain-containing protein [Polymorphobacter sp. PAMC 29334]|uniref:tyrosine-type recombinase/integrase n=1 Tax=Polymorphobacter sp. PAMC 29334 TaxID=2862331 RepID=UPI001C78047B|nr:site-specific integrase [Polymorphobacter sp. PAMC 29334]QYE35247.1 integrase arm-type DNA-binding domain-containing protein [Polymorphobacter sp. PAMC 29334]